MQRMRLDTKRAIDVDVAIHVGPPSTTWRIRMSSKVLSESFVYKKKGFCHCSAPKSVFNKQLRSKIYVFNKNASEGGKVLLQFSHRILAELDNAEQLEYRIRMTFLVQVTR